MKSFHFKKRLVQYITYQFFCIFSPNVLKYGCVSVLLERETELTQEQFWWVMNEWCARGEGFLKSIWQTEILSTDELPDDDRAWAESFRPRDFDLDSRRNGKVAMHGETGFAIRLSGATESVGAQRRHAMTRQSAGCPAQLQTNELPEC
jgi:hypothetical protein